MAEDLRFAEYRTVAISDPLRQGDVLEKVSEAASAWDRHLLVITADCDFANGKHQGRVTCVPLLSKDEYLLRLILPKVREATMSKLIERVVAILSDLSGPEISHARLREWPLELETSVILQLLSIPEESQGMFGQILDRVRELGKDAPTLGESVESIIAAQAIIYPNKKEAIIRNDVSGRLQSAFRQPSGDALFLSALADGYDNGYFVYLRHLEQVWEPEISLGPSHEKAKYRRLSRIKETYTHALAQRFALVFMSIGLPDEYEEMRNLHSEMLAQEMK